MDKFNTELFGEFTYAEYLTYEALLLYEARLMEKLDQVLQDAGAEHIDFSPLGDILMFQCAFVAQNLEILRDIADELASLLPKGVRGRIICLQKDLSSYHALWIARGQWQEKEYALPRKGPEEAPLHKVTPESLEEFLGQPAPE